MDVLIATLFMALGLFVKDVGGLRCYRCHMNPLPGQNYSTTPMCTNFDYSAKYVVDCPHSTMCMKKDFHLPIQKGVHVTGVIRDCAPQLSQSYAFSEGNWRPEQRVVEPYKEGCDSREDDARIVSSSYCYCRRQLCNASPPSSHEGYTDVMAVIVVFNLMKYINSIR